MLMRPAKCEAKAEARYHKAGLEAKAKKNLPGRGQTLGLRPEMPY